MYRKRFISSHFKTFTRLFVFEDKFITSIITLWVAAILSLNHFLIHNRQDWSEKLNLIELWKKNVWSFFIYFVFKELIVHSFNWSFGRPKHWGKLGIRDNRVERLLFQIYKACRLSCRTRLVRDQVSLIKIYCRAVLKVAFCWQKPFLRIDL